MNKTFLATFSLLGGIIGAGFLGIPYVLRESGVLIGLIEIAVFALILMIITLFLNNFLLSMKGNHQFTGYAEKHFGKIGKFIMFCSVAVGLYSAILAYLIGVGQSLSYIFFGNINYQLYFGIGFWIILSILIYLSFETFKKIEVVGVILALLTVVLIVIFYSHGIKIENLTSVNLNYLLIPIGVIWFSLTNFSGIPIIKRIADGDKKVARRATIFAYSISFIMYAVFVLVVVGFKGKDVPEIATLALGNIFIILGILTIFTSAFSVYLALKNTWFYDWNKNKTMSWVYTVFPSLILFIFLTIFGFAQFTLVMSIGVYVSGGITGLFFVLLIIKLKFWNKKKK